MKRKITKQLIALAIICLLSTFGNSGCKTEIEYGNGAWDERGRCTKAGNQCVRMTVGKS